MLEEQQPILARTFEKSMYQELIMNIQDLKTTHDKCHVRKFDSDCDTLIKYFEGFLELIDALEGIDMVGPVAKINETTISDNKGGRIEL